MPTTRTAEKELRVATKRLARNKSARSATKTSVTRAESAIASGNLDEAKVALNQAISALDKEAEKGTVHRNNAARRKARLMKKFNQLTKSAKPETEKTEKKPRAERKPAAGKKTAAEKKPAAEKEK